MAFSLGALGAGLGQFAQDYRQQQESALRQQQMKILLQNQQRDQQARALMGQVLAAGGIPGFGGGGIGGAIQQTQTQPMGGLQPPPGPQAGPGTPPLLPGLGGGLVKVLPGGGGGPPAASSGPRVMTEEQQQAMEDTPGELSADQADQLYRAAGAGESRAGQPLPPAAPASGMPSIGPDGLQKGYSPEAYQQQFGGGGSAPAATAAAPAESAPAAFQPVQTQGEMSQALSLFQHVDPSAIAKRIKEVRPDASDEAVGTATQELYKMASGNIREQLAAASMAKFLWGEQGKQQRFDATMPLRERGVAVKEGNLGQRKQTEQRLTSQFQERVRQFNSRLAELRNNRSATDRRTGLSALLRDVEKSLYPGFGVPQPSDEEKAALSQQRVEIQNELRKNAGMKPLEGPAAPAAAPIPGPTE